MRCSDSLRERLQLSSPAVRVEQTKPSVERYGEVYLYKRVFQSSESGNGDRFEE